MRHIYFYLLALLTLLQGCSSPRLEQGRDIPYRPKTLPVCPPCRPIQPLPSITKKVILLDPGHGGEDFGTHSNSRPRYEEKYLNLSTARLVRDFLAQKGYNVILSRDDDSFISLDERAQYANECKALLFVSIHYNSAPSREAHGVEVFYYRSETDKGREEESKILAKSVLDSVLASTKAKSRGVKQGNFSVIRNTTMPAILIEGGFLSNDEEMDKIKDPIYLKKVAWGIAQGIHTFINS